MVFNVPQGLITVMQADIVQWKLLRSEVGRYWSWDEANAHAGQPHGLEGVLATEWTSHTSRVGLRIWRKWIKSIPALRDVRYKIGYILIAEMEPIQEPVAIVHRCLSARGHSKYPTWPGEKFDSSDP